MFSSREVLDLSVSREAPPICNDQSSSAGKSFSKQISMLSTFWLDSHFKGVSALSKAPNALVDPPCS